MISVRTDRTGDAPMCLQCLTEAVSIPIPLPGWFLCRATKSAPEMTAGQWGLGQSNDPDFIWTTTPVVDPQFRWSEEQIDAATTEEDAVWQSFLQAATDLEWALVCDPVVGHDLYEACCAAGYDREVDGPRLALWLFHTLAGAIDAHEQATPTA
jgi:hypothetical protein